MKDIYEKLGFYFLIFQRGMNEKYVKCWMDGDENWTYITVEDLFDLVDKSESPYSMKLHIKECLRTTSIFLWDVSNYRIKRVSPSKEFNSYMKDLIDSKNELENKNGLNSSVSYDTSAFKKIKSFFKIN